VVRTCVADAAFAHTTATTRETSMPDARR
jgi:hypothetical protein